MNKAEIMRAADDAPNLVEHNIKILRLTKANGPLADADIEWLFNSLSRHKTECDRLRDLNGELLAAEKALQQAVCLMNDGYSDRDQDVIDFIAKHGVIKDEE
jgi:hypothetical protein